MPRGKTNAPEGAAPSRGDFFHIEVRPRDGFKETRKTSAGGVERIEGRRDGGDWEVFEWQISKRSAHVEGGRLIADSDEARKVLDDLDSIPEQVSADLFRAKARPALSDREKSEKARKFAQRLALEKDAAKKKPGSR